MTPNIASLALTGLALIVGIFALAHVLTRDAPETDATRYDRRQAEWRRRHQAHRRRSDAPTLPRTGRRWEGQALIEFALIAPVAIFAALGFIEAGFLVNAKGEQDRATAVVADYAASHPGESWQAVAAMTLPGCDVEEAPGGPPDVITITAVCHYDPVATYGLWDGLPIGSEASAAAAPTPSPSPSPSPSGSVTP